MLLNKKDPSQRMRSRAISLLLLFALLVGVMHQHALPHGASPYMSITATAGADADPCLLCQVLHSPLLIAILCLLGVWRSSTAPLLVQPSYRGVPLIARAGRGPPC